ncbi:MAG TPA: hypothetical protein VN578_17805 [Candidatus Binatia bacterium]|nr:hypothetical protein [Candidatus Binatia bacterium]
MTEVIIVSQLAQEPVLDTLHLTALGSSTVIVAAQVKDAVDDVADQFALPGGSELAGLPDGFFKAHEDLAVQGRSTAPAAHSRRGIFSVVKRHDVGCAFVAEKSFVEPRHLVTIDELDTQLKILRSEEVLEESSHHSAKKG